MTRFEYASPGLLLKSNHTGKNSELKIKIIHTVFYFVRCRRLICFNPLMTFLSPPDIKGLKPC